MMCTKDPCHVCGTDGKTYGNPCLLKGANCRSSGIIEVSNQGNSEPDASGNYQTSFQWCDSL